AARRLSEERELSPAIFSLLSQEQTTRSVGVRIIALDRIESNPEQPRLAFNEETLQELSASIREHGVLQPILVRPLEGNRFQLIAGERRWRASKLAGVDSIPALIEDIDDDTALEISIIENLQREDISPLDEAAMYDRMVRDHGYSIRQLVSLRKDTLSHAYELMKVDDPKKRKRLADQVAAGQLTLIKLREKIEGRRARPRDLNTEAAFVPEEAPEINGNGSVQEAEWTAPESEIELTDDSLVNARHHLAEAIEDLVGVLRSPDLVNELPATH